MGRTCSCRSTTPCRCSCDGSSGSPSAIAGDPVAIAVEVIRIVANDSHRAGVVRAVAASAFAVVIRRVRIKASALIVGVAVAARRLRLGFLLRLLFGKGGCLSFAALLFAAGRCSGPCSALTTLSPPPSLRTLTACLLPCLPTLLSAVVLLRRRLPRVVRRFLFCSSARSKERGREHQRDHAREPLPDPDVRHQHMPQIPR